MDDRLVPQISPSGNVFDGPLLAVSCPFLKADVGRMQPLIA